MFDLVAGLPAHPLVVHAGVVLWPLAVLGLLAILLVPRWRARYGPLVVTLVVVAAAAVLASKESGEALAHRIGSPHEHEEWADRLTAAAGLTMLATLGWALLEYRHHRSARTAPGHAEGRRSGATAAGATRRSPLGTALGALAGLLGLASLACVVLTGHTGAEAAWGGRVDTGAPTSGASSSASASAASSGSYTMAQVAAHKTASDCWVAITAPGQTTTAVYDLTPWVAKHPGGPSPIAGLCGTDGTAAFTGKHGEDGPSGEPARRLAAFKIGTLAG